MTLHDCQHTYEDLVHKVFPQYIQRLESSMKQPWSMEMVSEKGSGAKGALKKLQLERDFAGAYVLIEDGSPLYVGIAKGVVARLCQHVKGKTHYDASLAYKMAKMAYGVDRVKKVTRKEAMKLLEPQFKEAKQRIAAMHVATIEITNPLEKYIFEPFAALALNTKQWNSFETH